MTDDELRRQYDAGVPVQELAGLLNKPVRAVYSALKRAGYTPHRPQKAYNLDRFATAETPEDAYWMGFIAADGCVHEGRGFTVSVAAKDRAHMESLCLYMGADPARVVMQDSRAVVNFNYGPFSERLTELGVPPRKTLTLGPPKLTDPALIQAYILGYFDGDGSAYRRPGSGMLRITLSSGSLQFLEWAVDRIRQVVPTKSSIRHIVNQWGSVYQWETAANMAERLMAHWQSLGTSCLARKQEVYYARI